MNLIENFHVLLMGLSFLPIAHFLGRLFLYKVQFESFEWKGLAFQVFGFGLLGYVVLGFGLAGRISPNILWGLYWVLLGLSSLVMFEWWGWLTSLIQSFKGKGAWTDTLLLFLGLIYLLLLLIGTLAPEIGNDPLCYHVATPKTFLDQGKITYLPYDINSIFPFLIQMLYLLGIGLKGILLAKLFHLEIGFFLFTALFLFLKDLRVTNTFFWALLFMLTPGISNQITTTHTDVALAAFAFLGVCFFMKGLLNNRLSHYGLAGIFFGFALSMKIIGIFLVIGVGLAGACFIISDAIQKKNRRIFSSFVTGFGFFFLCILLACFFWYLRAYLITGNPFFPYFDSIFGKGMSEKIYEVKGMGTSFLSFLLLSWNVVIHATSFGNRSDQIGPLFLALSPFLIWAILKVKEARLLAIAGFVATILWFFIAQRIRFFYPILLLFYVVEIVGFQNFKDRFRKWGSFFYGLFWIPLLLLLALGFYHYRFHLKLATGEWSSHQFLEQMERSTVIADYINANLPQTGVKILNTGELHRYYIDRPMIRERGFERVTRYSKKFKTPEAVVNFLKSQGFTHILFARPVSRTPRTDQLLSAAALVRDEKNGPEYFELLFESKSKNTQDQIYDYALYRIR